MGGGLGCGAGVGGGLGVWCVGTGFSLLALGHWDLDPRPSRSDDWLHYSTRTSSQTGFLIPQSCSMANATLLDNAPFSTRLLSMSGSIREQNKPFENCENISKT